MTDKQTPDFVLGADDLATSEFLVTISGRVHRIPGIDAFSIRELSRIAGYSENGDPDKALDLILANAAKPTRDLIIEKIPARAAARVLQEWLRAGGEPGESSESSESSETTDEA